MNTDAKEDDKPAWEDDCLKRQEVALSLTGLARNMGKQKLVISVNGDWGTGKTFMLRNWQKELQENGYAAIYFDAWQDDFIANPLVAIIGQLQKMLEDMLEKFGKEKNGIQKKDIQQAVENLLGVVKKLQITLSIPFVSVAIPSISNLFDRKKNNAVQQYRTETEHLEKLRKHLGIVMMEIRKSTDFPLVFIIDELDRCRPTFAIEVLERVKHLFGLSEVVFVFGINKSQLKKSIQSVYGKINADEYLRKFFNLDLNLPPAQPSEYCKSLLADEIFHEEAKYVFENFYLPMVNFMRLSLRDVEYSTQLFRLGFLTKGARGYASKSASIACLVLLKTKYPNLYLKFILGECNCKDVINKMAASWDMKISGEKYKSKCEYHLQLGIYCIARGKEWDYIYNYLDGKSISVSEEFIAEITTAERQARKIKSFVADITTAESQARKIKLIEYLKKIYPEELNEIIGLLDLVE